MADFTETEHGHSVDHSDCEDKAEQQHWLQVLRSLRGYQRHVQRELGRRQTHINRLPQRHAARLSQNFFAKTTRLNSAAAENQDLLEDMVHFYVHGQQYDQAMVEQVFSDEVDAASAITSQQHRNEAVLHSLYREWSSACQLERDQSFGVIVSLLCRFLPVTAQNCYRQRVLVPGCGLGRLPVEIAARGYCCEGNEFSSYMIIASNFVLNGMSEANCREFYPWITNVCNVEKTADLLESVSIPDVSAVELLNSFVPPTDSVSGECSSRGTEDLPYPKFCMSAGDFVEIYGRNGENQDSNGMDDGWDAVATCFFIDTAPVVIDYIEAIYSMLKPGGVWVNLGPLLYHWVADVDSNNDSRYSKSIELSYEEIKEVIQSFGFEYLSEEWSDCTYTRFVSSMMHTNFRVVSFVVRKPLVSQH